MATTEIPAELGEDGEPRRDKRMTLAQHLLELRRRLVICAAAVLVGMIAAFILTDWVIQLLMIPIEVVRETRPEIGAALNFTGVTTAFNLRLQMSFATGLLIAAPVWLWQIWAFIMPAMTRKEIRYTIGFAAAAVPLFFGGCAIGIWVAPHVIEVMANFVPDSGTFFLAAMEYYDLIIKLLLAIGIACVLPVFLVGLNLAGIMSGRSIVKGWRIAVLVATIFAAVATPAADVVSMLILAGLLVVLYMLAAVLTLLLDRRRRKKHPELYVEIE